MNSYFKKFIICFCIVGFLFSPLRFQRANAIAVVDDCIIIGGVLVTTYVVAVCLEKAGAFEGFDINSNYSTDVRDYLSKKILSLSASEIAKYFFTAKDSSGNDYVALTDDGYSYAVDDVWPDMTQSPIYKIQHSTSKTTSVTTVTKNEPFMKNGLYMVPYFQAFARNYVYSNFFVKTGDTLRVYVFSSWDSHVVDINYTVSSDTLIKISSDSTGNYVYCYYSTDNGVSWPKLSDNYAYNSSAVDNITTYIGYSTSSNTVYVPGSQVVSQDTPIDKPADSVIAVPISGQYSSDGTTRIYDGIDGGVANAVTGLKASDLSNTGANTGEGTDTGANTLTQEAVRDAVRDGIGDSTVGDLDIPSDVPRLDFTPLEVATKKFPFCVPFDFANLFVQLNSPAQCPVVSVPSTTVGSTVGLPVTIPEIDFDLSTLPNIDNILNITKFFEYIGFLAFLILKTRNLIRG